MKKIDKCDGVNNFRKFYCMCFLFLQKPFAVGIYIKIPYFLIILCTLIKIKRKLYIFWIFIILHDLNSFSLKIHPYNFSFLSYSNMIKHRQLTADPCYKIMYCQNKKILISILFQTSLLCQKI